MRAISLLRKGKKIPHPRCVASSSKDLGRRHFVLRQSYQAILNDYNR